MKRIWTTLGGLMPLLPSSSRKFLSFYVVATCLLAALDTVALAVLALSLSAMVQGASINFPLIGSVGSDGYVWVLLFISLLIIVKSLLSLAMQWLATRRLASFELEIGDRLFDAYIHAPWTDRLQRNTSQLVRMADVGIANATAGFLLPLMSLPTLATTSIAVLAVIIVAQPLTALITLVYLGLIASILYFVVSGKSVEAGVVNRNYSFKVARLMTDMVSALKEITLRNKATQVAQVVHVNRVHTTRARANIGFLGAVPKFILDSALVGGFILVGGVSYAIGGMAEAFAAVALFGVAGFRMIPSLTGFQSVVTTVNANIPQVTAVIADIKMAEGYMRNAETIGHKKLEHEPTELVLSDVSFTYPSSTEPALRNVNLRIPIGSTLGLVGSSGAGKSTLVDLILGLLVPSEGKARIDDEPLEEVLADWRARVGYVPQEVALFDGTVAENVALTWNNDYDSERVKLALERAQLWAVIEQRPGGINSRVGDRGMSLSGGQRQRLGIARALYSDPLVLVLDEATSALDTKTESDVANAIRSLAGRVTVVSVAHRLSTIRDNDQVCYMENGMITASGTFDEVVQAAPDFAHQAALAGLHENRPPLA